MVERGKVGEWVNSKVGEWVNGKVGGWERAGG